MNKPIITRNQIIHRVAELGKDIHRDYRHKPITIVWVYEGALHFYKDVTQLAKLGEQVLTGCIRASSYKGTESGPLKIDGSWLDPASITGRSVLVIDDILDTGKTLTGIVDYIMDFDPADVKTCVLLRKPSKVKYPIEPSYLGFDIEDLFVVGYGLDYNGLYRHLRYITTVEEPAQYR